MADEERPGKFAAAAQDPESATRSFVKIHLRRNAASEAEEVYVGTPPID